ncbi:MAG TPA: ABC transporter ATP-binding protein [Acidimicrobiia bacterium]|nr:ABC transporter ATP-binding protein [Acidimicrobiia bacterium]
MSSALEIEHVVKSFRGGRGVVLDQLSLHVDPGELVVLVGPSGSGKSTTLHLVAALDHPNSGHIRVHGRDVTRRHRLDRFRREELGIIFQLHNLLPHLDAQQNLEVVMLGGKLHRRQRRARAKSLLAVVCLDGREHVRPPELSGGERQRIAVARAFANDPKLVLADEPTGSLDDDNAAVVIGMLRDRCESGGAVLAVSHDPRLTAAATRVLQLVNGRIRD